MKTKVNIQSFYTANEALEALTDTLLAEVRTKGKSPFIWPFQGEKQGKNFFVCGLRSTHIKRNGGRYVFISQMNVVFLRTEKIVIITGLKKSSFNL